MPTERFSRLCPEKQETIRKAAFKEFQRVSPEEVSINRIVQEAEISRGSFYTYFESKYDLLRWLIEDKIDQHQKFYMNSLEGNGGDIWKTLDEAFAASLQNAQTGGFLGIINKLMESKSFLYLFRQKMEGSGESDLILTKKSSEEEMYRIMDKTKCPLDMEEFTDLIGFHLVALLRAIKMYYHDKNELKDVEETYQRQMRLLRYGACKITAARNI